MEYCEGGDLYTKINRQRGRLLPENIILHYFVQLCKAVQVAST
jgi:NIMA (never in mitosis gene a)-related kinase